MPARKLMKRPSASDLRPLGKIDSRYERLPSSRVKLTPTERTLLKDPDWIDEDEADLILAIREERESNPKDWISVDDYVRRHGRVVRGGRVMKHRRG